MTLLQQMHAERAQSRERLRLRIRAELLEILRELAPAPTVVVFGSLIRKGRFTEHSDVDVALPQEPAGMSIYQLTSLVSERLGYPVDIVLLPESRLRSKILREGETWTLQA